MKEIVEWLIGIEKLAGNLYSEAASLFPEDREMTHFLQRLVEDEAWHYNLMSSAREQLRNHPDPDPFFSLDSFTIREAVKHFEKIKEDISSNSMTKEMLIHSIASAEFSEWNDIFLYVVDSMAKTNPAFKSAFPKLQKHMRYIEHILESTPEGKEHLASIRNIPSVWKESILIVEDNTAISKLLEAILYKEGKVDFAVNGEEGLKKTMEKYYRLIICDIDMPVMNGIDYYKEASRQFPGIGARFLFFTANDNPDLLSFFSENKLRYLIKPASVQAIKNVALEMVYDIKEAAAEQEMS